MDIRTQLADEQTIEALFEAILGRPVGNDIFKTENAGKRPVQAWIKGLIRSEEFKARYLRALGVNPASATGSGQGPTPSPAHGAAPVPGREGFIADSVYRVPALTRPALPASVLVAGSCLTDTWKETLEQAFSGLQVRHVVFNNGSELEALPPEQLQAAAFQIVQIPLRGVLSDEDCLAFEPGGSKRAELESLFESSVDRVKRSLHAALKYNREVGLPAFVLNFARPQANPLGRLLPKHDLSNLSHFLYELNARLEAMVRAERGVHLVDFDEITATLGKRYIQDDLTSHLNHSGFIGPTHTDYDTLLTPPGPFQQMFQGKPQDAVLAVFNECLASWRIARGEEAIKIVIFDLDGTLWRGVPADHGEVGHHLSEGWPFSMVEAAAYLKKRGVLLALASKNDPEVVHRIWSELYGRRFPLSNFVCTRIGWQPKAQSVAEILEQTRLLATHALLVDDNPVEREQVKLAFPEIKVLEGPLYNWRRTLLWGTELQVPQVSEESASRTESTRGAMEREQARAGLDEEAYLRSLRVTVRLEPIGSMAHPRFGRALELLNKTNQFNSTGRRWREAELIAFLAEGGRLLAAEVADRHNAYGLTALLLHREQACTQVVMSCRVLGLRVEHTLLAAFLHATPGERGLLYQPTERNGLWRDFLSRLGLLPAPGTASASAVEAAEEAAGSHSLRIPAGYRLPDEWLGTVTVLRSGDMKT